VAGVFLENDHQVSDSEVDNQTVDSAIANHHLSQLGLRFTSTGVVYRFGAGELVTS
jgi:hypothetical protein